SHKKYKAHDEKGEYKIGDTVVIEECRPLSKDKRWKVIKKI
ncbi:MAG: 30S ribosomal protein S17, partial [Candidatus Nealsonbacteria bacterium CG_4_8_14_3_um_filter_39_7]